MLIFIVLLALFALIVGSLQVGSPPVPPSTPAPTAMPSHENTPAPASTAPAASVPGVSIDGEGRSLGPADTETINVWNDLSCRECRQWSMNVLLEIMTREVADGEAHVVINDFVADNDGSRLAARAGWAADQQDSFWAFYLAAHSLDTTGGPGEQGEIPFTRELLEKIATIAELDMAKFTADLDSDEAIAAVEAARLAAEAAGVDEAPSIQIGEQVLIAPSAEEASEALSAEE